MKTPSTPSKHLVPLWLALCTTLAFSPTSWAQRVKLATSMGDVVLELNAASAPKTVANFVQYVKDGHYDGTMFHRVIDGFMIQGGGYKTDMSEKTTRAAIVLESRNGLNNVRGSVAMARTAVPDSATAQFFINLGENAFLDQANSRDGNGYAVFGKVVDGMDVIDKIRAVPVKPRGQHQHVPETAITIKKATLEK
jgi:peptidyl-prolyl cis-trans isomerase A (cyclophilin A)